MAAGVTRKISAASARSHTRKSQNKLSFMSPSGVIKSLVTVLFVGVLALAYQATRPPPPKICGSPDGPSVTAPRIKLKDGRYLAYKEHGVPKDKAKHKIVFVHGFSDCRHNVAIAHALPQEVVEDLGIYIVSFDRPGYGESDPNPNQTLKTRALDVEELADQLELGPKFYIVGYSMGGQYIWPCLKYIPHRLAGATLLAPVINYWWPGLPSNLSTEAFSQNLPQDQWALRVAHYLPWLIYWWNTQKLFPASAVIEYNLAVFSPQDKDILSRFAGRNRSEAKAYAMQQGQFESLHRDIMIGFGNWEFSPLDLENPFPNNEVSVHLWQGDDDKIVPVTLQRYIAQQLPWIQYHEITGAGHLFPLDDTTGDIVKTLVTGKA